MEAFIAVLPNLSIGVVSVLGLLWVTAKFLAALDEQAKRHERVQADSEKAIRLLEADVRRTLSTQLVENTLATKENTIVMQRIVRRLDGEKP